MRALGATPLSRSGWDADIAAIGGVDVVLDGVAADGFRSSYRALRRGGRFVGIGTAGASGPLAAIVAFVRLMVLYPWLPDGRRSGLYSIGRDRKRDPGAFRRDLEGLFRLLEQGTISPEIAEELALDQVAEAHARLEAGGIRGKLVLRPWAS
ncbi:MAG: zinc-binding dehydrogenase [Myxococcota bacterium]